MGYEHLEKLFCTDCLNSFIMIVYIACKLYYHDCFMIAQQKNFTCKFKFYNFINKKNIYYRLE